MCDITAQQTRHLQGAA